MKWTGLNDLRESYLKFFESKGHLRMASAPLVPQGDNSVLLINAGMTPLKKYFQGIEEPPRHRVTTCQKCIRTPDIDNVGKTARHGTYFEMLGNFSFGDYFKHEATAWAWEYLTKVLEIPEDRLWVTIYEEDDEAGDIWANEVGVPRDRIIKLGKADNFWEHGSGPCGPCSEIHFDRGEKYGPFVSFEQAGECDRIIEIWNLVFTQFDNDGKGNYTQLATKNIDTGMGLERLACVMQDVDNLFEVDTIQNIMKKICSVAGVNYHDDPTTDVSIRVITDHIRSTTFMVGDGIRPSNEGRGYVLRRLLRRAARHGRMLGVNRPFLYEICDTVINENLTAYPELDEKREYIKKVIKTEEESFAKTVDKGMQILGEFIKELSADDTHRPILSGENLFKLHDTYGFPIDLTREILQEKNIGIDEERFFELMNEQKAKARSNQAFKGGWDEATANALSGLTTTFVGYKSLTADSKTAQILDSLNIPEVDGMLFDLGVSSPQLDETWRGFSYMHDAPLDMRMDSEDSLSAYEVVNTWPEDRLNRILWDYGEERYARRITNAILAARATKPIESTLELVDIIKSAMPAAALREKQHPAKRTFQAIRIAVNDELGAISTMMETAPDKLRVGGRLCVISFHSLEDRIVKTAIAARENGCTCPREAPVCTCGFVQTLKSVKRKPILPSEEEIKTNPRSRSAKLRVAERV